MRSRLQSMAIRFERWISITFGRHGLNFIKLDGDIGCLGMQSDSFDVHVANSRQSTEPVLQWPPWT